VRSFCYVHGGILACIRHNSAVCPAAVVFTQQAAAAAAQVMQEVAVAPCTAQIACTAHITGQPCRDRYLARSNTALRQRFLRHAGHVGSLPCNSGIADWAACCCAQHNLLSPLCTNVIWTPGRVANPSRCGQCVCFHAQVPAGLGCKMCLRALFMCIIL
jgi:hypothetical protein